jgi:hypothetical protein
MKKTAALLGASLLALAVAGIKEPVRLPKVGKAGLERIIKCVDCDLRSAFFPFVGGFSTPPAQSGYQIARSLRFNSADSAYLNRTPGSAGNRKQVTLSLWLKRGKLGANATIFSIGTSGTAQLLARFDSSDRIEFWSWDGAAYDFNMVSTAVFRDPSAWYHLVFYVDTTAATSRIYVNGSQLSAFGTNTQPTTNDDTAFGIASQQWQFSRDYANANYFDGYMAEVIYVDGQALTPSSFGETNVLTGGWVPKAYSGGYGTNGFWLSFANNASTTTIGYDDAGGAAGAGAGSNDWTATNFSITAGVGNDSVTDTPTNYGTDTGAGGEVRGNYCTLNPLDKHSTPVLAEGNLKCTTATGFFGVRSTWWLPPGLWYWEATVNNVTDGYIGIASLAEGLSGRGAEATGSVGFHLSNGQKRIAGSESAYGTAPSAGNTLGFCYDGNSGKFYIRNASGWFNSGDPVAGTGYAQTGIAVPVSPSFFPYDSGSVDFNFGQRPFAYSAPTGFKALCTQNLTSTTVALPATFTGNANADGPYVWANGIVNSVTINGNVATEGTHFRKVAGGIKLITSSSSYNQSGSNTVTAATYGTEFKYARAA